MARPSNTEQRRTEITQAFVKVMAEQGYDGASIGDIARAAGLSPGLVHYHFENKRAILLSALEELLARHLGRLDLLLADHAGDPARQLDEFIDLHLATGAHADPEALKCWILFSAEALRESAARAGFQRGLGELLERLEALIQRGVAQKVFTCQAPGASASAILALIQGYFVLAATARDKIPRSSAAPSARLMTRGLLGAGEGPSRRAEGLLGTARSAPVLAQPAKRQKARLLAATKTPATKTSAKTHTSKVSARRGRS